MALFFRQWNKSLLGQYTSLTMFKTRTTLVGMVNLYESFNNFPEISQVFQRYQKNPCEIPEECLMNPSGIFPELFWNPSGIA